MDNQRIEVGGQYPEDERIQRSEQMRLRLARYCRIFSKFWWIPAVTIGMGLAFQGWQALTRPLTYDSHARILVSGRISIPEGGIYSEEAINFFGTQIELIRSQEVNRRAAARVQASRPDLPPVGVSLSVSQIPRTSIFVLRASGTQPDYVKAYLNAVIEEYIALRRGILEEKSESTLTAITAELARVERELRQGEQEMIAWKSENNLVFLKEGADAAGSQLARLNSQLAALEAEFSLMDKLTDEQNLGRVADWTPEEGASPEGEFLLSSELAGPAQEYFSAQQRLFLMEREREQLLEVRTDAHPKVRSLDDKIRATKRLIEVLGEQARDKLDSRKQGLGAQIENTRQQIEKWEERALILSRRMGEYERMQEKLDREKSLYDQLLGSIQRVDVNANIQQDILSVMEYATPPAVSIRPLSRELVVGALAGLAVGIAILLLIAAFDDRVASVSEIQALLGEEVIGIVPEVPQGQQLLKLDEDDNPGLLEATRKIRSWLLYSPWENGPPSSLMISSAVPKEGKSTSAFNIAMCLASSKKSVLLIDCDLRRGKLHRLLEMEQDPGVGNVLNGECEVDRAIHPTVIPNLSFMPRGFYEVHGSEVFFGASLDHLLATLESRFDFVIFDTAPSLATDESSVLAGKMDTVLLVVRSGFSSLRLAKRTLTHLEDRGAAVGGVIYNGVNPSSHEYPYYHYYYYYDDQSHHGRFKGKTGHSSKTHSESRNPGKSGGVTS